jgi:hypothetical protein
MFEPFRSTHEPHALPARSTASLTQSDDHDSSGGHLTTGRRIAEGDFPKVLSKFFADNSSAVECPVEMFNTSQRRATSRHINSTAVHHSSFQSAALPPK